MFTGIFSVPHHAMALRVLKLYWSGWSECCSLAWCCASHRTFPEKLVCCRPRGGRVGNTPAYGYLGSYIMSTLLRGLCSVPCSNAWVHLFLGLYWCITGLTYDSMCPSRCRCLRAPGWLLCCGLTHRLASCRWSRRCAVNACCSCTCLPSPAQRPGEIRCRAENRPRQVQRRF